jgi:hypothetical protein
MTQELSLVWLFLNHDEQIIELGFFFAVNSKKQVTDVILVGCYSFSVAATKSR